MKQDEIEIKLDLSNETNYRNIINHLSPEISPVKQENYFFDTQKRSISNAGWALRIRKEAGKSTITAKGPRKTEGGGLTIREEIEEDIDVNQAGNFIENGINLTALPPQIAKIIMDICPDKRLEKILSFVNYRTIAGHEIDGIAVEIAIDRTEYSDDSVDFEFEAELSEKSKYKSVMAMIDGIFEQVGVPIVFQAESKYARALKKADLDSGQQKKRD